MSLLDIAFAVGGFTLAGLTVGGVWLLDTKHRVAGWLCFLLVALGMVALRLVTQP